MHCALGVSSQPAIDPLHLSPAFGSQIIDTMGFDDNNPRRLVLQRRLEERLRNVIVVVNRDLSTSRPAIDHLLHSPFLVKWFNEHLNPDPSNPAQPKLCFMMYWWVGEDAKFALCFVALQWVWLGYLLLASHCPF